MPQSDDPPSAPPAVSVESETTSASGPSPAADTAPAGGDASSPESPDRELHRPRRRRRRRRRPPRISSPEGMPAGDGGQAAEGTPVAEAAVAEPSQATPTAADPLRPPRHRRRRRRRPQHEVVAQQTPLSSDGEHAGETPPGSDAAGALPEAAAEQQQPANVPPPGNAAGEHRRRRRRRRPPTGTGSSTPRVDDGDATAPEAAVAATSPGEATTFRGPRVGRPRNRRPRQGVPRDGERRGPGFGTRQETGAEPRDAAGRQRGRRDQRADARGPRRGGPQDRQRGRGRDAPLKRPEPRLYALESVVDRGFEDVTDETDESQTHRVHWTIIKRTVADQNSRKPMSAVYVLQREGAESEFPNLGAARAAVNKTIIHPEKLTLSKAEHAAAKSDR
jgi:hypothetical protein